ncbi:MAG: complex I subunit 1 family protein [Phycisphaerales bacterium]
MFSAQFFVSIVIIAVVAHMILGACAYLIFLERKVAAWTQDRIGPNRTNFSFGQDNIWKFLKMDFMNKKFFFGLGQALADGVKLLVKEDYTPPHVDKMLFCLAPVMVVIPAMIGWAVVPWGGVWDFPGLTLPEFLPLVGGTLIAEAGRVVVTVAPISIGVIFMLAVSSLGVYGIVIGAYASNNKYSFLGGLRATAQMLSYEIPMGVCVLVAILCFRSSDTTVIVAQQAGGAWGILMHPLLAVIFFTCVLAETNRAPFDLAEAEQELVGGFHTEYSSMKWALFFLAEYMHMIAGSAFFTILFLGGWDIRAAVRLQRVRAAASGRRRALVAGPAGRVHQVQRLRRQDHGPALRDDVDPLDAAALPLRSTDETRLARPDPDHPRGHARDRHPDLRQGRPDQVLVGLHARQHRRRRHGRGHRPAPARPQRQPPYPPRRLTLLPPDRPRSRLT